MNLIDVIVQELGDPDTRRGQPFWVCPFHADENPSLTMYTRGGREKWKCFGCGQGGDAIDFLRLRHPGWSFGEAKRKATFSLTGQQGGKSQETNKLRNNKLLGGPVVSCPGAKARTRPAPGWWGVVVEGAEARLWQGAPRLLGWLRGRGLQDLTIRAARLGVNEEGLVIPWFSPGGELQAVNVRRFNREPKYRLFKNSARGQLYPVVRIDYRKPVLLCEGELDTLLARQEVSDLVQAVTLGSASNSPGPGTLVHLALCRSLLAAFDGDPAGDRAFRRLRAVLKHARRVRPPEGQDLTDLHRAGGLRSWFLQTGWV